MSNYDCNEEPEDQLNKIINEDIKKEIDENIKTYLLARLWPGKEGIPKKPSEKRKVTRIVIIKKEISECYHRCPYFELDGGPGPVMMCAHPKAPNPYIISHPDCIGGFPEECPLKNDNE